MLDLSGLGVRDAEAREAALAAFGDALLGAVRAADGAVRSTADALVSLLGAAESSARSAACQALGVVLIRDSERPCLGDGGFRRIRDALIGVVASGEEVDASCLADALDEVARHREATPADRVAVVQALATTVARTTEPFDTEHDERIAYALVGVVAAGDVAPQRGRGPIRDGAAAGRQCPPERQARAASDGGAHRRPRVLGRRRPARRALAACSRRDAPLLRRSASRPDGSAAPALTCRPAPRGHSGEGGRSGTRDLEQ